MKKGAFHSKKRRERIGSFIALILVIFLTFLVLFPIWWIFRTSLMTNSELYAYPPPMFLKQWLFENYKKPT